VATYRWDVRAVEERQEQGQLLEVGRVEGGGGKATTAGALAVLSALFKEL
jgi:hypothetical protein